MRVVQVLYGKFHHFHLARALAAHDELTAIFTGYPWSKLREEGINREQVRSFPWVVAPYMAANRLPGFHSFESLQRSWEWMAQESIDRYAQRNLPECDVVVGLSASGLRTGREAQRRGAKYVCDRGSTHIRFQQEVLNEEYGRWKCEWRGIDPRVVNKQETEYAAADLITVPSRFTYESFIAQGVPASKMAKVAYGANMARFSPRGAPDAAKFVVLFVGQISLRKGIPYLLQAFSRFQHPQKELWIVGSKMDGIEKVLRRMPLEHVVFKGTLANSELAALYSQAHVFVLPSIEEGLAMVQGEALACGCPVIASENTGAADLFNDGREGFIVPARDVDAIVRRLNQLAEDPQLRERMSVAALERVNAIGGWQHYGMNYRAKLHALTGARAA